MVICTISVKREESSRVVVKKMFPGSGIWMVDGGWWMMVDAMGDGRLRVPYTYVQYSVHGIIHKYVRVGTVVCYNM